MDRSRKTARRALGVLVMTAMAGASVAPAMARDHYRYPGYGYGYGNGGYGYPYRHRHHRRDGLDAGDVIGIAALIGAVAVIASAASKNKKAERYPENRPYDDRRSDGDRGYGDARDEYSTSSGDRDDAVNACASAARDEAERGGGYAQILEVEEPRASGSYGWNVQGSLEQRRNYQDRQGLQKNFNCTYEKGQVVRVNVRDYVT